MSTKFEYSYIFVNIIVKSFFTQFSVGFTYFRSVSCFAVAIRTGTVRRVWFAIRTAVGIFLAIVGEIFVFFDFYNLTFVKQQ